MASVVARAYSGGLGAMTPVGFRETCGEVPAEAESYLKIM